MNPEMAAAIVVAIAAVEFAIWLFALHIMLRVTRERQALVDEAAFACASENPAATISGAAKVEGRPDLLAAKFAQTLAHNGLGYLATTVKITAADQEVVRFEAVRPTLESISWKPFGLRRGAARFSSVGNKTRIEYCIEIISVRYHIICGWLSIAFVLAAILVGLGVEFGVVIPRQRPAIRADDVFAMLIILGAFLLPFAFAHDLRKSVKLIKNQLEILLNNLPHT